jgi:thaumarchaeosortase
MSQLKSLLNNYNATHEYGKDQMSNLIQKLKDKIQNVTQTIKKNPTLLIKIAPIFSFIIPFLILYYLYPASFEATWKGRTYYLFFIWLILLELILNWEKIQVKIHKIRSKRFMAFITVSLLPTFYVIISNFCGLNTAIVNISPKHYGDPFWANLMPLSVEYLVFSILFVPIISTVYGIKELKNFLLPPCLIGVIGLIYVVDNLCPYGYFTPFQILVPTTTNLAATVLNMMGYETNITYHNSTIYGPAPYLKVQDPNISYRRAGSYIAWPCSGIDSLIIYSAVILLFLKNTSISWKKRIAYFLIGAVVTYFINILRIVTIFLIGMDYGMRSPQVQQFHNYYGALYSIIWIMAYPLIIIGTQALWRKIKKPQLSQLNLA